MGHSNRLCETIYTIFDVLHETLVIKSMILKVSHSDIDCRCFVRDLIFMPRFVSA